MALVNMVSQPQELYSSAATFVASGAKQDVDESDTIRWYHTTQDPFANIHAALAALRRKVDELRRKVVPVTVVNMEDQNNSYHATTTRDAGQKTTG